MNIDELANYAVENRDDKVKGTVQLLHGLSRAPDIDTADKAACSEFLASVLARYPQYTGLLTIAPQGDLHCDSLRTGRKLNLTGRDYFKQLLATAQPAFDVVFGGLTGIAVLQVAHPVLDSQGKLKYVLLASFNLSGYARSFAAASHYPGLRVLVWDRKGNLMTLIENLMEAFLVHPFHLNDAVFRISIKVGSALFPDDGADADTLFKNAEAALKKAKSSGERYLYYTHKMTEAVAAKLILENQLRNINFIDEIEHAVQLRRNAGLFIQQTGAKRYFRDKIPGPPADG